MHNTENAGSRWAELRANQTTRSPTDRQKGGPSTVAVLYISKCGDPSKPAIVPILSQLMPEACPRRGSRGRVSARGWRGQMPASTAGLPGQAGRIKTVDLCLLSYRLAGRRPCHAQVAFVGSKGKNPLLVRLLARQAARKFVKAGARRPRTPPQIGRPSHEGCSLRSLFLRQPA